MYFCHDKDSWATIRPHIISTEDVLRSWLTSCFFAVIGPNVLHSIRPFFYDLWPDNLRNSFSVTENWWHGLFDQSVFPTSSEYVGFAHRSVYSVYYFTYNVPNIVHTFVIRSNNTATAGSIADNAFNIKFLCRNGICPFRWYPCPILIQSRIFQECFDNFWNVRTYWPLSKLSRTSLNSFVHLATDE